MYARTHVRAPAPYYIRCVPASGFCERTSPPEAKRYTPHTAPRPCAELLDISPQLFVRCAPAVDRRTPANAHALLSAVRD